MKNSPTFKDFQFNKEDSIFKAKVGLKTDHK